MLPTERETGARPGARAFGAIVAAAALLVVSGPACAGRSPFAEPSYGDAPIRLEVENQHYLDVVVFAMPDGVTRRLGSVTGKSSAVLEVPVGIYTGAPGFRLLVDPVGSSAAYLSEEISAGAGQVVVLQVAAVLRMSTWYLR